MRDLPGRAGRRGGGRRRRAGAVVACSVAAARPCPIPTTSTRPPPISATTARNSGPDRPPVSIPSASHVPAVACLARCRRRRARRCRACRALSGPAALGRGVIVESGAPAPEAWADAPRVVLDDAALASPAAIVERAARLVGDPHAGGHRPPGGAGGVERARDRRPPRVRAHARVRRSSASACTSSTRANNYDARDGTRVGAPPRKRRASARASRARPTCCSPTAPRRGATAGRARRGSSVDAPIVHRFAIEAGALRPDVERRPRARRRAGSRPTSARRCCTRAARRGSSRPRVRARPRCSRRASATSWSSATTAPRACARSRTTGARARRCRSGSATCRAPRSARSARSTRSATTSCAGRGPTCG